MSFFLIYNIVITCKELKDMRFFIFLLIFFNFFNIGYNKFYSINKEKILYNAFFDSKQKSTARLIYKDGVLNIEGLNGNAHVTIYSIIGNQIAFFSNIDLSNFKESVSLQRETMYIARIEFSSRVLTYKFFTR
tara:strand:- start:108 stop:506 length:399 start_codon:yes stop_codon:yes gene_type:complete